MALLVHLVFTLAGLGATGLFLIKPLLSDNRGAYLFGNYSLLEIHLGFPAAFFTVVMLLIWLTKKESRSKALIRGTFLAGSAIGAFLAVWIGWAGIIRGGFWPNYWLDGAHIDRAQNQPDDELGFTRKPGIEWSGFVPLLGRDISYSTDDQGFRNAADAPKAVDVVFVGDSYTEAAQVAPEDTFVQLVADKTGQTVRNLGRGAYGPQQELIVLQRYALSTEPKPKVVVWQLFEGNDLKDAAEFASWRVNPERSPKGLLDRLLENSPLMPLLAPTVENPKVAFEWIGPTALTGGGKDLTVRYYLETDPLARRPNAWPETEAALRSGVELCREQGVDVVLAFVPSAARVLHGRIAAPDDAEWKKVYPAGSLDVRPFAAKIQRLATELGVGYVDLLPALERRVDEGNGTGVYLPSDEHFDLEGHQVVAEEIARAIR
ncbi:MAG: SGNH/GDSL hydrolase family protein [Planctomycetota bacterium]